MDLELANQVAVVAGGARGIGRAIAEAFAREGARTALIDAAEETADAALRITKAHGVPALGVVCDITDEDAVEDARERIRRELGGFDHVVVSAAIGSGKFGFPFLNLEPSDWDRVLRVNLLGAVRVAHAFAPGLMEKGSGSFVFLSSVAAQFGSQTDPPYSASKAALGNFAQCMARDLAPHGVRVNTVCPGMVKTPLNRAVWEAWNRRQPPGRRREYEDWAGEKVRERVPLGRWQEPEDVADMAVFLASERARNVTGQTINVDGGYVMR